MNPFSVLTFPVFSIMPTSLQFLRFFFSTMCVVCTYHNVKALHELRRSNVKSVLKCSIYACKFQNACQQHTDNKPIPMTAESPKTDDEYTTENHIKFTV